MKADWYNVIRLKKYGQSQNGFRSRLFDETQGAQQEQRLQAIIDSELLPTINYTRGNVPRCESPSFTSI